MTAIPKFSRYLDRFVRVGVVTVSTVGLVVIAGWVFNIEPLKGLLPGLATMKLNTAICIVALSLSLWLLHTSAPGSAGFRAGRILAAVVALFGLAVIVEVVFDYNLGIDELLVADPSRSVDPGRMSPVTAVNFLLLGLALVSLNPRKFFPNASNWLALASLLSAALALIGYAYGVPALYQVGTYIPVALHTALCFFVLALCVIAAGPSHGVAILILSDTAGGLLARRLLPTLPIVLFLGGWARLAGQQAGYYDTSFGVALMALFGIAIVVFAVALTAAKLRGVDKTRRLAETELADLNRQLEQRVADRTHELAVTSAELVTANGMLEALSLSDGLTGIANRRHLDAYLAAQVLVAARHDRPLTLLMYDIDGFKDFNDHYGHQAGDECLKRVAAALKARCRRPADLVARYGGEEFAMVLPDTDLAGAIGIAEQVLADIARLQIAQSPSWSRPWLSISAGAALLQLDGEASAQQLIRAADENLFSAKRRGRNRVESGAVVAVARARTG